MHFVLHQMYRGQLNDGSLVAIRCFKLKENHSIEFLMPHVELISKLRHLHIVSALGHGFEYYLEDSSVSRLFLVFEYVPNGTLRSWISGNLLTPRCFFLLKSQIKVFCFSWKLDVHEEGSAGRNV